MKSTIEKMFLNSSSLKSWGALIENSTGSVNYYCCFHAKALDSTQGQISCKGGGIPRNEGVTPEMIPLKGPQRGKPWHADSPHWPCLSAQVRAAKHLQAPPTGAPACWTRRRCPSFSASLLACHPVRLSSLCSLVCSSLCLCLFSADCLPVAVPINVWSVSVCPSGGRPRCRGPPRRSSTAGPTPCPS